ncbi:MAG TPA: hypothetical protein DD444_08660 [Citreicella sp.]|uniref:Uncharacterized protein n=1 Tax=Salipiger marinus TaxID=555512 RepID=A0A1G8S034_9RHOB|nr:MULTISPECIES: hypothetical protein [Salipiger]MCD1616465.1 hypothetical protein [Salipiger manganoxidans]SDJ22559.1 hypothetical protein SAMN04487993_102267 [Salipiger marinus]HBM59249.1 hypothetical protein [Citreicella sp.]HBS99223.1 hypothetical protein [Citreicella sp.]
MPDRARSQDGRSETQEILDGTPDAPGASQQQGRKGGEMARKVGTRDEEKRHDETSAGRTRPLAQDQNGSGDKEKV